MKVVIKKINQADSFYSKRHLFEGKVMTSVNGIYWKFFNNEDVPDGLSIITEICLYEPEYEIIEEKEPDSEFKAGDEVEVRYNVWNEGEWRKRTYGCFLFGKHWCRHKSELEMVSFDEIRKPDSDKVYREMAKEIMKNRSLNFEKYGSRDGCNYMEFDREFLEETLIEAIKKGKEL